MDNQQERFETRMAWLTGIIEGEGWVSLGKAYSHQKNKTKTIYYKPQIGVVNCDMVIMDEVMELFSTMGLRFRKQIRESKIWSDGILRKSRCEISISSVKDIMNLSKRILPYMIGDKKRRLLRIIDFIELRKLKGKGSKGKYGDAEELMYKELYSFKGKSRSKILNDYTPNTPCVKI